MTAATPIAADPRPPSAVSGGAGLAGIAGVFAWIMVARHYHMDGPYAALVNLVACGVPMALWSLLVDKVHRNLSTGIDWTGPRPWRETIDISLTKLAGLWITWGGIALIYATGRFYWIGNFAFAMWCLTWAAPVLFVCSVPYVLWIDRRLVAPRDGAWMLGAWMTGQAGVEREAIYNHLRSWGVKAFFLAFMLGGLPGGFGEFVRGDLSVVLRDPVALSLWLIALMFLIDMAFATVGYVLTFRPLDSHIRTANPFAAAWMAALICYPPLTLMMDGGVLDYHIGTASWTYWLQWHPVLLALTGAVLVGLTGIYAWATVAFGPRFSNLTNRGILTHGPYRWTRHPAYWSKNLFWWISTVPLLSTGSLVDAARATLTLMAVSGVYYWRAKTEERHLMLDPDYRAYNDWILRNGAIALVLAWVRRRGKAV
ncbi:protein-S-isoprenylcysteine methyltransferase [Sphingomonas sp. Leaf17]|uniref:methyltransferase family protein n=1 Tax=Sphingomonas sp. Leaf17 TaxID=1735683 RepID=UPI0006F4E876|nr:protein-S-isoprenylcysteine methyltransferase [Sphingomonas sp. Leaf17]